MVHCPLTPVQEWGIKSSTNDFSSLSGRDVSRSPIGLDGCRAASITLDVRTAEQIPRTFVRAYGACFAGPDFLYLLWAHSILTGTGLVEPHGSSWTTDHYDHQQNEEESDAGHL